MSQDPYTDPGAASAKSPLSRRLTLGASAVALAAALFGGALSAGLLPDTITPAFAEASGEDATEAAAAAPEPQGVPVSVALVESRDLVPWDTYSGRLEAVEHVAVRARVAGQVQAVHFREGGLVQAGDVLVTLDPAPYAVETARARAEVTSAEARVAFTQREYDRAVQLAATGNIPRSTLDSRLNAHAEAKAALDVAKAALDRARLDQDYTEVRAPVSGRVGKAEVTVGNLVSTGAGAPVLTTLVSVDPIYAAFDADEEGVMEALSALRRAVPTGPLPVERIPVRMTVPGLEDAAAVTGHVQMIDNTVNASSGTVRVRAVFDNPDGLLMPGQFARLSMGRPEAERMLLVSDRAVGTDQDKKYVMVVDPENRADYRAVTLGERADGLRVVTGGLSEGDRVIVNGLQRVRPGALTAPDIVSMDTTTDAAVNLANR